MAVLAYLAVGGPRDRDHLAALFWHNSKNGLNSLSTTLNRIRAEVPGGVWIRGNSLVGTELPSDVADLRDAIDRSDFESVAQLYGAPFLGNLKLRRQSAEFEEWVLSERTTLAAMVELALLQRGRELFDAGEHRAAATAVERAWEIAIRDGFPSPDYFEVYHQILASAARPGANAVRSMAEEFGISLPAVEPLALDPIAESQDHKAPLTAPSNSEAPAPSGATPLFGCKEELEAIASSVASQRLTTVVGLGGSGKTRLVTEFFNSSAAEEDFPHRYWVNLQDVLDQDLVAPAIATSLGQRFDSVASLANQLPDDEPVLLVLDNFEQVLGSAAVAAELVQTNAALRVLITSRVPLKVAPESLVRLTGLRTSDHEPDSPAEQLFVSSARRAGVSDNRLSGSSRAAIHDVCRRVGGNPLALEIAGGWVQILSPTEILDALSVDNELLGTPMDSDLRSVEAVLNQTWSMLDEADQNTLMLLATFPGGCLTKEALKLRQLSIRSIGRLVQHSLARLHVEGRITLHPLIASYAQSELEQRPQLHAEYRQVLSDWCQGFTTATPTNSTNAHPQGFDAEVSNFTSAWLWDAQNQLWELHRVTLGALRQFFTKSGRVSEGRTLFAAVADALKSDPNPPQGLLAEILEALGWFEVLSGETIQARARLEEALALSSGDDSHARAQALRSLGVLQLNTGEIDEATANFTAGLALISHDPSTLTASLQYDLAQAHHYRGDRDQAASAARLALQAGRAANDQSVMTTSYLILADIEVESDPERAIVLLNEGWAIAKEASLDSLAIYFPSILGLAHLKLDDAEAAEQCFTDGIEAATNVDQLTTVCANHVGRAEARLLRKETAGAIDDLKAGIRLALKTGAGRYLMWAAVVSCRVGVASHTSSSQAKELLLLTLRHSAADQDARDKALKTLLDLFDFAPEADLESATDSDEAALDEVAERALQLLSAR